MLANKNITPQTIPPDEYFKKRQYFAEKAIGGYPFVGTPDRVADELATIGKAGMRGIALSFVNYLDELPYFCDEVLPRLVRLGARVAHLTSATARCSPAATAALDWSFTQGSC